MGAHGLVAASACAAAACLASGFGGYLKNAPAPARKLAPAPTPTPVAPTAATLMCGVGKEANYEDPDHLTLIFELGFPDRRHLTAMGSWGSHPGAYDCAAEPFIAAVCDSSHFGGARVEALPLDLFYRMCGCLVVGKTVEQVQAGIPSSVSAQNYSLGFNDIKEFDISLETHPAEPYDYDYEAEYIETRTSVNHEDTCVATSKMLDDILEWQPDLDGTDILGRDGQYEDFLIETINGLKELTEAIDNETYVTDKYNEWNNSFCNQPWRIGDGPFSLVGAYRRLLGGFRFNYCGAPRPLIRAYETSFHNLYSIPSVMCAVAMASAYIEGENAKEDVDSSRHLLDVQGFLNINGVLSEMPTRGAITAEHIESAVDNLWRYENSRSRDLMVGMGRLVVSHFACCKGETSSGMFEPLVKTCAAKFEYDWSHVLDVIYKVDEAVFAGVIRDLSTDNFLYENHNESVFSEYLIGTRYSNF